MAQLSMADILESIKKKESVAEDGNILPSLQNLATPIAPFRTVLSNQSQLEQMPADIRADIQKRQDTNDKNASQSADFIRSMIPAKPFMLRDTPLTMDSQPKMVPEETEAPVMPAASMAAPVAGIKQAFQATQSPEQKQVAQNIADQQNPLVDSEMESAMEATRANRKAANQNSMFADLSNAIIGQSGSYNKDNRLKFLDRNIENADKPVEDVNTERDQYKKFLANNEEREKADPNSAVSKAMRDALARRGVKIPANASYSIMEKLGPELMKDQQFQEEMNYKFTELGYRRAKDSKDKQASDSVGQKEEDKKFAKEFNEYTSAGRINTETSINKLKQIRDELKASGGLFEGGGRTGDLPEILSGLRSRNSIKWRDNAKSSANATLKELFPGALSDDERKAAAEEFYNDKLGNKDNADILDRKITQLERAMQNKDEKSKYFQQNNRSLSGYTQDFNEISFQPKTSVSKDAMDYYNQHKQSFQSPEEAQAYMKRKGML